MDKEEKPLPGFDQPSAMEPLLKRIAESIERLEKKQPPAIERQSQDVSQTGGASQFANAGNIQIDPSEGQQQPSMFGRAAIALQSTTNMLADYGIKTPPALHSALSLSKAASFAVGDTHTRGEALSSIGKRPNTGGDETSLLRSIEIGRGRDQSTNGGEQSQSIARNDLKDSIDSLKEAIDQLKESLRQGGPDGKSAKTILERAPAAKTQVAPPRGSSRPVSISIGGSSGNPNSSFGFGAGS